MVLDNRLRREMSALRGADTTHMVVEEPPDFTKEAPGSVAKYHIEPRDEGAWVAAWSFAKDEQGNYYGIPCRLPKNQLFSAGPNQEALMDLKYPDGQPCFTLEPPAYVQPQPEIQCFVKSQMGRCRKKFFYRSQIVPHVMAFHTAEAEQYKEVLDAIRKQVMAEDTYLADFVESLKAAKEGVVAVPVLEQVEELLETTAEPTGEIAVEEPTPDGPQLFFCEKPYCSRFFDSDPSRIAHQYKCKEVPVGTAT